MAAGDWTGHLGSLAIGPGTNYAVNAITGWKDAAGFPLGVSQLLKARQVTHGAFGQPYLVPTRMVSMTLHIVGTSSVTFAQAVANLEAQAQVSGYGGTIPLSLQVDGVTTTVNGALDTRTMPTDFAYSVGYGTAVVNLTCFDPRRLGTAITGTTYLPSANGGLTFNAAFNVTFNASASTGSVVLNNTGETAGPLTVNVYGPLSGAFTITCAEQALTLGFSSSVSIAAGDYLMIDMENRNVLYNGQATAARNAWVSQRGWFDLAPGANTLQFNASTYSSTAYIQATGNPAWL